MMRFLARLLRRFGGSASPADLPSVVQSSEPLTRFIFSSDHFAATKGVVKARAFLPDKSGETSVFRIEALSNEEIWRIGNGIRPEQAKARGDIAANAVYGTGLSIHPATADHPRHAVIVGWPAEKDKKLMLATLLSQYAVLRLAEVAG